MDEERMSFLSFDNLLAWSMPLSLLVHLTAGIALGVLYFRSLWWNARRFAEGGRATTTIALMIGRFVLLGAVFTLASLEGAIPLLAMSLGVLFARCAVTRSVWAAAQ